MTEFGLTFGGPRISGRRVPPPSAWLARHGRYIVAAAVVLALLLSACAVMVTPGQAVVVTRLGDPVRVLTQPGLGWRAPPPLEPPRT